MTLRATEDENSTFAGWGGACPGTDATCEAVLAGPETIVRPRFDLKAVEQGLLHVRFRGAGLGTVTSESRGPQLQARVSVTVARRCSGRGARGPARLPARARP